MKKSLISLGVAALISGVSGTVLAATSEAGSGNAIGTAAGSGKMHLTTATDLQLAPGGVGHILLVPYFTTQGGNVSLLNITNTDTVNGKAVKIRFRGAGNSDDILDFQIYLSPGDMWTTEITQGTNGVSQLTTYDTSCTLPSVYDTTQSAGAVPFKTGRIAPNDANFSSDLKAAHTREGYIEIFTMADIPPMMAGLGTTINPLYTAIKHANGVPGNCNAAALQKLWMSDTDLETEAGLEAVGLDVPTTGLMATSIIMNTRTGFVSWSANADAIVAVDASDDPGTGRVVFARQLDTYQGADPVALGDARKLTNDPLLRLNAADIGYILPQEVDFPDLSTPYTGTIPYLALPITAPGVQANLLTETIAKQYVVNEYLTTPSIGARTDWTFSMPTRRYHVATAYADSTSLVPAGTVPSAVFHGANTDATPSVYFVDGVTVTGGNTVMGSTKPGDDNYSLLCVHTGSNSPLSALDREEGVASTSGPVWSPPDPVAPYRFCSEASVLSFNSASEVLYSTIAARRVDVNYTEGWAQLATPGMETLTPDTYYGLPILGAAYIRIVGEVRNGASTNYGLIMPHRY